MLFHEIRRIYWKPVYLIVFVITGWLFFLTIQPKEGLDLYEDYDEYEYYKPLSKKEFIYFHLTKDFERKRTIVFVTKSWVPEWVSLSEKQSRYIYGIIQKLNPDYHKDEKMSEVKLQLTYSELKPFLEQLEKLLGENSFYYTCFEEPVYGTYAFERYGEEDFKGQEKNFILTYKYGISKAYARIGADTMGCFLGFLCILFSFRVFCEEKKHQMEAYIFTGNLSSARYVCLKFFSIFIPITVFCFLLTLLEYFSFLWWNVHYEYGYQVEIFPFLKLAACVVLPGAAAMITISMILGVVLSNPLYTVILQFILYYYSISGTLEKKHGFSLIVRYGAYDDYESYQRYSSMITLNRFAITMLAIGLAALSGYFFHRKRNGGTVFPSIKKIHLYRKTRYQKSHRIAWYLFRQVLGWNVVFYILYTIIMLLVVATKDMDEASIAVTGENILIFASLFLFVKIGNYEYSTGMDGFFYTADCNPVFVVFKRFLLVSLSLFAFVEIPLLFLCIQNNVALGRWCLGIYISAFHIGISSLLVTEISGDRLIGYFFFIGYYFFNVIAGEHFPVSLIGYTCHLRHTKYILCCFIFFQILLFLLINSMKMKGIGQKSYEDRD